MKPLHILNLAWGKLRPGSRVWPVELVEMNGNSPSVFVQLFLCFKSHFNN